jgi:hypothetical protein
MGRSGASSLAGSLHHWMFSENQPQSLEFRIGLKIGVRFKRLRIGSMDLAHYKRLMLQAFYTYPVLGQKRSNKTRFDDPRHNRSVGQIYPGLTQSPDCYQVFYPARTSQREDTAFKNQQFRHSNKVIEEATIR